MSQPAAIAFVVFCLAMAVESVVWLTCLRQLKAKHPQQWLHAEQPLLWQNGTLLSARRTMLYFHHFIYLSSLDEDGIQFCNHRRTMMLSVYWLTAMAGAALLVTLALCGWTMA